MGISEHPYTRPCTILNRVPSQVADTCGITQDSAAAVDGESLHGHAVRVLNIHDRQVSVGAIGDRGPGFSDQCQSIHTSNHEVSLAIAQNGDLVWPLRIGSRKQTQSFMKGFVSVTIHG